MAYEYVPHSGAIVTRDEAVESGKKRYFLNKPCKQGHISQWFVRGGCVYCHTILNRENTKKYASERDAFLDKIAGRKKPKVCDVCGKKGRRIVFDHCNASLKFRGWLCDGCNMAIGLVHESPERLRALAVYLEKNSPILTIDAPKFYVTKRGLIMPQGWQRGQGP